MAEYGRRLGRAKELCGQRLEGSLSSVEVAPFHQYVDQNPGGEQAEQQWRGEGGGVQERASVGFGGGQIAAPIGEPGPGWPGRRKDHPVGRSLRLGHRGVEERLSVAVALGVEQCNRRGREPRRVNSGSWQRP